MSQPRILLQLEGLMIFVSSIALYAHIGGDGWLFIALLFVPDVSMVGYMLNKRVGAGLYNLIHMITLPLILGIVALAINMPLMLQIALIWGAHIGLDRAVGYGLKYNTAFKDTHLGRV